ncbi:hypothetical protein M3Y99_00151600 [Aphelenchoides fujianensis]|nr:hypothetical protein M3Y99_00151600 [Aphelenchoides fujianensis]
MALQEVAALGEIVIACILFGTLFVPVKRFQPGDGLFSQFMMCLGIWTVGFAVHAWTGFGEFYPLAMVGGILWCLGNLCAVPIIEELGLGLAVLLFSVTNCVVNYAVGTFGMFATTARPPAIFWLSLVGMALVVVGGILISFVKTKPSELMEEVERQSEDDGDSVPSARSSHGQLVERNGKPAAMDDEEKDEKPKGGGKSSHARKGIALFAAVISGLFYGVVQVPIIAIQDNEDVFPGAPKSGLPFIFSHYCGIFLVSFIAFLVYSIIKKNSPSINPSVALPSFCSGLMWGTGMCLTIVCTQHLSQSITGPITAMVPGCVATLWSVFYFREIKGGRNLWFLWGAIAVTIAGAVAIGLSNTK